MSFKARVGGNAVIPALKRLRQEDSKCQASQGYKAKETSYIL
jgi:hypothetical protein